MKKTELLELGQKKFSTEEVKVPKKSVEEFIEKLDLLIEGIIENGELDKTRLGKYITVELVDVEAKSGSINGKEYHTEARRDLKVKASSICKNV